MSLCCEKIIENHAMIDAIRVRKNTESTVELLKDDLGVSRTTADKMCASLLDTSNQIITRKNRKLVLLGTVGYFLGISIGSKHIRVTLLDLNFEPVSTDWIENDLGVSGLMTDDLGYIESESNSISFAYKTPSGEDFESLKMVISALTSHFLVRAALKDAPPFPLMGIGFAVCGPVDYTAKSWRSAPRMTAVQNITILDLIGYDNQTLVDELGIFISIDNNAKSAIVSEYQYLLETHGGKYGEDIALIYIGSGVGSSVVMNNSLLRGSQNLSGELGHIKLVVDEHTGKTPVTKSVEERLIPIEEFNDPKEARELYVRYIPYILNIINCILGIDRFILVGHSIAQSKDIIPSIMAERMKFTVSSTQKYCTAEKGRGEASTAAIGAAIEAYYSMCCYDVRRNDGNRINLAHNLTWQVSK